MATFIQSHISGQIKEEDMRTGLGLPLEGCLTEYRCFPVSGLVAVPDYLTDEEASCLPIASITAWMSINGMRPLNSPANGSKKQEYVLLQGTGGVSIAGLQIAHAAGLKTIITSSSDGKLARARELGADYTINYKRNPDWEERVMEITDGEGADIIFETGGAQTLRKSFACVAFGGLINSIGYLSGKEDEKGGGVNMNVLALSRNVTLKGIINGPRERFEEMTKFYESHQIRPVVDKVFKFEEGKEALKYLYSGSHFGKVVIRVSED